MRKLILGGLAMVGTFALVVAAQPLTASADPSGNNLVISEAMSRTAGVDDGIATAVEIANPPGNTDPNPTSLTGWVLEFRDASDVPILEVPLTGSLEPGEFVVVEHEDFNRLDQIEFESGVDALPDDGGVVLFDGPTTDPNNEVDRLGFSSAVADGGSNPAEQLNDETDPFDASIQRDVLQTDTDVNKDDFDRHVSNLGSAN